MTRILLGDETKTRRDENIKRCQCTIYHLPLHPGAQLLLSFIGFAVHYSLFLSVVVIQSIHSRFAFSPPDLFDGKLFKKFGVANAKGVKGGWGLHFAT